MDAIRYFSRTGNTKKMAEMIGEQLDLTAKPLSEPLKYPLDTLYLGGAIHMASLDKELKEFAASLDAQQIGQVVMFGTSGGIMSIKKGLKKALTENKVKVSGKGLFLHGFAPGKANFSEKQQGEIKDFTASLKG